MLVCCNCNWMGDDTELVCTASDPDNFSYCPECESPDLEEDDEDQ